VNKNLPSLISNSDENRIPQIFLRRRESNIGRQAGKLTGFGWRKAKPTQIFRRPFSEEALLVNE
jgi:hypothetical protein